MIPPKRPTEAPLGEDPVSETTPSDRISPSADPDPATGAIEPAARPKRRRTDQNEIVALRTRLETAEVFTRLMRELRTLVSASEQCVRLADGDDVTDAQQHHYHKMSLDRLAELTDLVSVMHDLSLIDAGDGVSVPFERAELDRLAVEVATDLDPTAYEGGIDLQWQVTNELPPLLADVAGLQRALAAVVGNAIKFTRDKGRVRVTAEVVDDGRYLRINVHDEGPGIPEDEVDAIFEPFVQGKAGLASSVRGCGLGLSIARAIIHRNGGDMGIRNHGSGGTVWLTVPLLAAAEVDRMVIEPALGFADAEEGYSVIVLGVQLNPEGARKVGPGWADRIQGRLRRTDRVLAMDRDVSVVVAISNSPAADILAERVEGVLTEAGLDREQYWIEPLTYPATGVDHDAFRARTRRLFERAGDDRAPEARAA